MSDLPSYYGLTGPPPDLDAKDIDFDEPLLTLDEIDALFDAQDREQAKPGYQSYLEKPSFAKPSNNSTPSTQGGPVSAATHMAPTKDKRCDLCFNLRRACKKTTGPYTTCAECKKRNIPCTIDVLRVEKLGITKHVQQIMAMVANGTIGEDGQHRVPAAMGGTAEPAVSNDNISDVRMSDADRQPSSLRTSDSFAPNSNPSFASTGESGKSVLRGFQKVVTGSGSASVREMYDGPMISGVEGSGRFGSELGSGHDDGMNLGGSIGVGDVGSGNASPTPDSCPKNHKRAVAKNIFCCGQVVESPIDFGGTPPSKTTEVLKTFVQEACKTGPSYSTSAEDLDDDDYNIWMKFMFNIAVKNLHLPDSDAHFYGMTEKGAISPLVITANEKLEILPKGQIADRKFAGDTADCLHRLTVGYDIKCEIHGTSYSTYCINWIDGRSNTLMDLELTGELYDWEYIDDKPLQH